MKIIAIIMGVLLAIGGVYCMFAPIATYATISWLIGAAMVIEGVAALTAVAVLFYVSNWMISKSESAAWTSYIEGKAQGGVSRGSMFTLGFTAWLAVFREGA